MLQIPKPKNFKLHPLVWINVESNVVLRNSIYGSMGIDPVYNDRLIQIFENPNQQQAYEEAIQIIMSSFINTTR